MKRRRFLQAALVGLTGLVSSGHTPYQQWTVYRQRHLLILTDRSDPPSYPLGKRVAAVLATHLPASRARVTRAPHTERIASLISSHQLDVALMRPPDAVALAAGLPPFKAYGPVSLRTLISIDQYLLVCREDFPARHAYVVTQTLDLHRDELPEVTAAGSQPPAIPMHAGALAYFDGEPPPDEAVPVEEH
jgi:hypothetical protein